MEGLHFLFTCKRKSRQLVDEIRQLAEIGCPPCRQAAVLIVINKAMQKNIPFLKIICWFLLIANLCVLTKYILFKEPAPSFTQVKKKILIRKGNWRFEQKNLQLFASIQRIANSEMSAGYKYRNIGGNILGFVPIGFLLPVLLFRTGRIFKTILAVFLISLFFETVQLYTGMGIFDVDDLFLNTLGGVCGIILFLILRSPLKKIEY